MSAEIINSSSLRRPCAGSTILDRPEREQLVKKRLDVRWNLRRLLAERGLFSTNDLRPLLADHGVHLSRMQVFRIVTQQPERYNRSLIAALCSILDCTPNDLLELVPAAASRDRAAAGARETKDTGAADLRPVRATIRRPTFKKS